MDLARRTARNSLYSLASFLWPIGLAIVATPYLIHRLGEEQYGLFALAIAAVGFLALLDLGMASAVVKFVSERVARRDDAGVNDALRAALLFYTVAGLLGLLIAALGTPFLVERVLDVPDELRDAARTVFYVAGVSFFFTMLLALVSSVPRAVQRFDITAKVNTAYATASVLAAVALVAAGRGVVAVVVANLMATVLAVIAYALIDRRLLPISFGWSLDRTTARRMTAFTSLTLVSTVSATVLVQLDKFVIGSVLTVAAVTFYVVPANLAMRLHTAADQIALAVFPVASELFTRGERERVHRLYVRATRLVLAFLVAVAVPPFVLAGDILRVWLGADFAAESTGVLMILLGTYALLGLSAVPFYVALGAGRPGVNAVFSLACATLNVVLMIILIPRHGIVGAAVAYLGSMVPVPLFIAFVERRILGTSSALWLPVLARIAPVAVAQAVVCALVLEPLADGVASLLLALGAGVALFPALYLASGLAHAEDRALARSFLGRRAAGASP